ARVGATPVGPFEVVGLGCTIDAVRLEDLAARVAGAVGGTAPGLRGGARGTGALARTPLVLRGDEREIRRLAVSTGAAGHDLVAAAHEGYDALLTGEPEEPRSATARELGTHPVLAGHYASEQCGVQALAAHLADRFELEWHFVEVNNPVSAETRHAADRAHA